MRTCRFCGRTGMHEFIDMGYQPPSNAFLTKQQLEDPETYYPLKLFVCDSCFLVQIDEYKHAKDIFNKDYVYYSSQSPTNVSHAKEFVDMVVSRFHPIDILEIGSNDGYLLQHFPKNLNVSGVDPSDGPANVANNKGIQTWNEFFDTKFATECNMKFDLICGINVIAHQPDINDFVEGLRIALAPGGVIIMEFPHLMRLIENCQFDTIYHEHYSYFSFGTICEIFKRHGLEMFYVEEIPEHGGSLRIYAGHQGRRYINNAIYDFSNYEYAKGIHTIDFYQGFQFRIEEIRKNFMQFLYNLPDDQLILAYGAAAKGNTFLNYCKVTPDLLPMVVDRSPHKQNKYLPGSHIRVGNEEELKQLQPFLVLILAWNLKDEVMEQLKYIREWGGRFVVAIPKLEVI